MVRLARRLVPHGLTLALLGCDPPPTDAAPAPQPKAALRPEADVGPVPANARVMEVEMWARLDAQTHRIDGRQHLRWRNTSSATVEHLPFHLYINGFRSEDTHWMAVGRGEHRGNKHKEGGWGYIDVQTVRRADGSSPTELKFAEGEDPSVMDIQLDRPLGPGEQVELELEFVTQLPQIFARTGYADTFHMGAQWFPKPGVLLPDGTWKNHVFAFHSEFFADFGDYTVHLDLPENMVVGASGTLTDKTQADGRQVWTYRAEAVHDFAWAADPRFVEVTGEHNGIAIRQLMLPEVRADAPAHFEVLTGTLDSMEHRFGPYPWSTITVIHPPTGAEGAGGMEYPTLFTTSAMAHPPALVTWLGFAERFSGRFTTLHEFGHQYFQGLLASDEYTQPWLDEGMNTNSNVLALADIYGSGSWVVRWGAQELSTEDTIRRALDGQSTLQPIDQNSDAFSPDVGGYGNIVYRKTAAVMLTLRNLVGHDAFDKALHDYAMTWRFRHPTGSDLEAALVAGLGGKVTLAQGQGEPAESEVTLDVGEFLEQGLHSTRVADFRVHAVINRHAPGPKGYHRDGQGTLVEYVPPEGDIQDETTKEAVVVLHRSGDFLVPVPVEVTFEGGETRHLMWSGRSRLATWTFAGQHVRQVRIDPEGSLVLEYRRLDNLRRGQDEPDAGEIVAKPLAHLAEASALSLLVGVGP